VPQRTVLLFLFWPLRSGDHLLGDAYETALLMRLINHFYCKFVSVENENHFLNYTAKLLKMHAREK